MNKVIAALAALFMLVRIAPAIAADQQQVSTLVGLPGVYVTVQNLNPAAEGAGLSAEGMSGDVELALRQHGVPVLTVDQMRRRPGQPLLKVVVNVHKAAADLFVYTVDVDLEQTVQLVRRPAVQTYAATWKTGSMGVVSADGLARVKDLVLDGVREFATDYVQANGAAAR